ncbi:MAG: hypothetical protein M9899_09945 [Bdellovibrionaceae bacterium]|nr:hypothetical protein [Pseudobdellovibrionaceae bacterium]
MSHKLLVLFITLMIMPTLSFANTAQKVACDVSLSINAFDKKTGAPTQETISRTLSLDVEKNQENIKDVFLGGNHMVRVRVLHSDNSASKQDFYSLLTYIRSNDSAVSDFYATTSGVKRNKQKLTLSLSTLNIKALNFAEEYGPFQTQNELNAAIKLASKKMIYTAGDWANAAVVCNIK